jgi:hypothetical protein
MPETLAAIWLEVAALMDVFSAPLWIAAGGLVGLTTFLVARGKRAVR